MTDRPTSESGRILPELLVAGFLVLLAVIAGGLLVLAPWSRAVDPSVTPVIPHPARRPRRVLRV